MQMIDGNIKGKNNRKKTKKKNRNSHPYVKCEE